MQANDESQLLCAGGGPSDFARSYVRAQQATLLEMLRRSASLGEKQRSRGGNRATIARVVVKGKKKFVHQTRIGVRRIDAALQFFEPLCPKSQTRDLRRQIKRIRRAADAARNVDVFLQAASKQSLTAKELRRLKAFLVKQRADAQKPLRRVARKVDESNLAGRLEQLASRIRWRQKGSEPSYTNYCEQRLQSYIEGFLQQQQRVDLEDVETLHQLRIAAKRLRYCLELARDAVPAEKLQTVLAHFVTLQKQLGRINDHATQRELIQSWRENAAPPVRRLFKKLGKAKQRQEARAVARFQRWWTEEHKSELRSAMELLRRPADRNGSNRNGSNREAPASHSIDGAM